MTAEQELTLLETEIAQWHPDTTDQHYESLVERRDSLVEWIEQGYQEEP